MDDYIDGLISVIVPVYNVEKYLDKCIRSITEQSYCNIEILLIDDGSTDSSGMICDRYSSIDSRIIVVHQENGGAACAKNKGLDIAISIHAVRFKTDGCLVFC